MNLKTKAPQVEQADPNLIKKLEAYQARTKKSWNKISDSLAIGAGVISQYRQNKYPASCREINKAVDRFLRIEAQKLLSVEKRLQYVEIRNSQRVLAVLETCHVDGIIGCVIGDTGTSKTTTVLEYARDNDVIYVEADRTFRVAIEYLRKIHQTKKVGKDGRGSLNELFRDIVDELRGTNTLIVIDQADYLNLSSIDVFRAISEKAGIGVVFVGLPNFLRKLRGNEPEVRQVRDRIAVKIELGNYSAQECNEILSVNWPGLNGLSEEFYKQSNGSLRILTWLVYNAKRIMASPKNQDRKLDDKLVATAASYLEIRNA